MKKGRAGTMTHDYKRHGTTTLFAALNVLEGTVIGKCYSRHRHTEYLRFLREIDRRTPKDLDIHLIEKWHDCLGDPTFADAILDRLVHNAYKLKLKGGSMRKKKASLTQADH